MIPRAKVITNTNFFISTSPCSQGSTEMRLPHSIVDGQLDDAGQLFLERRKTIDLGHDRTQ